MQCELWSRFDWGRPRSELVGLDRFIDRDGQIAVDRRQGRRDSRGRSAQQKHDLADELFFGRQRCELLNLRDRKHAPFDNPRAELVCRNVLGDFRQRLRERYRIGGRIRNRIRASQIFEQRLGGSSTGSALGQRVYYDAVLSPDLFHGAAKFVVFLDSDALKRRENHGRNFRQIVLQIVQVLLLLTALFHFQLRFLQINFASRRDSILAGFLRPGRGPLPPAASTTV